MITQFTNDRHWTIPLINMISFVSLDLHIFPPVPVRLEKIKYNVRIDKTSGKSPM